MMNDKLITENMGYVVTLARQYKSDILSTDDLVSEGTIGLIKAAQKYDPSKGKPFVTFAAPYIRRSIEAAISRLQTEAETRSTDESLPVGSHNNYTLLNVLEDVNAPKTDAALEQATLSDDLRRFVNVLNEREQAVISRFFGIEAERQTMAEIGDVLGMKRERVRQVRDQALRKLRRAAKLLFLLFYLFTFISLNAKDLRVLAIGNSFSEDAVEQYLYELAAAQGDTLIIGNAYIGGCTIDTHYENLLSDKPAYRYRKIVDGVRSERRKATLKSIIQDEQWDIISLQQASQLSGIPSSYLNLAQLKRLVQSYTSNLHTEFVWHMTWAYADDFTSERFKAYNYDQRQMYTAIVNTMQNVLPAVGIQRVIPSGTAIQLARYRMGDILNRDGFHLSLTIGRYTAACTWCEFLTGRIVDGNSYHPDTISEEDYQTCQQAAHEAIFMQQLNRYVIF